MPPLQPPLQGEVARSAGGVQQPQYAPPGSADRPLPPLPKGGGGEAAGGIQPPQYAPPPPPYQIQNPAFRIPNSRAPAAAKKKSKTPFIIGSAAVLVVALVVAGVLTKGFGLFGGKGSIVNNGNATATPYNGAMVNGGVPFATNADGSINITGLTLNIPPDASDEEMTAYEFMQDMIGVCEIGWLTYEIGLDRTAHSFYCTAASSISSMRYAVDCLLGLTPEEYRPDDWDYIASLSWASPAAWFFEGVVHEAQGRRGEAAECYRKAALNPDYYTNADELKTIKDLDADALNELRAALMDLEDQMFEKYEPMGIVIPRHENNFDTSYLKERAQERLDDDDDVYGALGYFHAALHVNPLDGANYAGPVFAYLYLGDTENSIKYLNEGLFIDPDNEGLNVLLEAMKEAQ